MLLGQPAFEDQNLAAPYHQHPRQFHNLHLSQQQHQHQQPHFIPTTQQEHLRRPRYPQHLDIDLDLDRFGLDLSLNLTSPPTTSSPITSPVSTTAATATTPAHPPHLGFAGPSGSRRLPSPDDSPVSTSSSCLSPLPELMPSNSWMLSAAQYNLHNQHPHQHHHQHHQHNKSVSRFQHNRDSSISSLGSTGPASPFAHSIATPHIAVTDAACDGLGDFSAGGDDSQSLYQLAKSLNHSQNQLYSGYANAYTSPVDHMGAADMAASYVAAANLASGQRQAARQQPQGHMQAQQAQAQQSSRGLLPAPDFSLGNPRSNPASVASSIGGDSPATPSAGEQEDYERRRNAVFTNPPKLDRTITDAYADELYSPDFTMTSPPPSSQPQSHMTFSAGSDIFNQRLQAANSQRLGMPLSPASTSRGRSPFRQDPSNFVAPPMHDFRSLTGPQGPFPTLQSRGHIKTEPLMGQHASQTETPITISPKEAMLDFHDHESEPNFTLFPSHEPMDFDAGHLSKPVSPDQAHAGYSQAFQSLIPAGIPEGVIVPQHYPFIPRHQQGIEGIDTSVPASVSHDGSDHGDSSPLITPTAPLRPPSVESDEGTYTCTYHGCTQRFETQVELQKHKREGHRQVHGPHAMRHKLDPNANRFNSQAGPHRCDRINPSTNKPCHTVFSRPYDLTRHEDTIHNGRKRKTRCPICTEEKTFSRRDALTRHYRVVHPDVELRGRHRRRHHAAEGAMET